MSSYKQPLPPYPYTSWLEYHEDQARRLRTETHLKNTLFGEQLALEEFYDAED